MHGSVNAGNIEMYKAMGEQSFLRKDEPKTVPLRRRGFYLRNTRSSCARSLRTIKRKLQNSSLTIAPMQIDDFFPGPSDLTEYNPGNKISRVRGFFS